MLEGKRLDYSSHQLHAKNSPTSSTVGPFHGTRLSYRIHNKRVETAQVAYEKQDIVGKDDSELSSCESDDEVPPSIIPLPLPNPPPSPASAYTLRKRCANASATSPSSRTSASKPASKALGKRAVVLEEGEEERRGCSEGGQQRGPNRRRTKRRRKHIIERGHTCPEALEGKIRASKPVFSHLVTESLPIASGAWVGMDSQFYGAKKVRMVEDLLAKGMRVIRYEKGYVLQSVDRRSTLRPICRKIVP